MFDWEGTLTEYEAITQLVSNYDLLYIFADMLEVYISNDKGGISIWNILTKNVLSPDSRYVVYIYNMGASTDSYPLISKKLTNILI